MSMLEIKNPNVRKMRTRFYPELIDPDKKYLEIIKQCITSSSVILDLGAGKGELFPHGLKGNVGKIIGVDLDQGVQENPYLDEWHISDIYSMPYIEDSSVDCIISRYVLEHVEQPARLVQEVSRILKPGGLFIFLTPNRWHYFFLLSKCTPDWFHRWVNKKRGIAEDDTFRTYYRINSVGQIKKVITGCKLKIERIELVESDPRYLVFNPLMYLMGVVYERLVNRINFLSGFRINIIGVVQKEDRS